MLLSLALILLSGLLLGGLMKSLRLPALTGYLIAGFLTGPFCLGWLDSGLLQISPEIRRIALVIILMKAGLSLDLEDLRRIGRPAVLLCFVPATCEIAAFLLLGPHLLGFSLLESALLGAVMAAVSPAVVVPRMTRMMDEGLGTEKGIPQMIVAGASADDVYVIAIFSALLSLSSGGSVTAWDFLQIPLAMLTGILAGAAAGLAASWLLARIRSGAVEQFLILLSASFLLLALEEALAPFFSLSGLLGVMSLCITVRRRKSALASECARLCGRIWTGAEIFLFALVGAIVDLKVIRHSGIAMVLLLCAGLCLRLSGTWLCVSGKGLTFREKLFCAFCETPKATVQAAIGGIPLSAGLACGNTVLAFAVLAILLTAPAGAFLIDSTCRRWLRQDAKRASSVP